MPDSHERRNITWRVRTLLCFSFVFLVGDARAQTAPEPQAKEAKGAAFTPVVVENVTIQGANDLGADETAKLAESVIKNAKPLFEQLFTEDKNKRKAVLGALVERIDLKFDEGLWGNRKVRMVSGGSLTLRTTLTAEHRGDKTPIELFNKGCSGVNIRSVKGLAENRVQTAAAMPRNNL